MTCEPRGGEEELSPMLHKAAAAGVSMHGPSLPQPLALWVTPRPLMCTGKFGTEASVQVCLHWP